jgi:hypothetical protein
MMREVPNMHRRDEKQIRTGRIRRRETGGLGRKQQDNIKIDFKYLNGRI